jgi:hypothetical protein
VAKPWPGIEPETRWEKTAAGVDERPSRREIEDRAELAKAHGQRGAGVVRTVESVGQAVKPAQAGQLPLTGVPGEALLAPAHLVGGEDGAFEVEVDEGVPFDQAFGHRPGVETAEGGEPPLDLGRARAVGPETQHVRADVQVVAHAPRRLPRRTAQEAREVADRFHLGRAARGRLGVTLGLGPHSKS